LKVVRITLTKKKANHLKMLKYWIISLFTKWIFFSRKFMILVIYPTFHWKFDWKICDWFMASRVKFQSYSFLFVRPTLISIFRWKLETSA
jgi:hypothetical protein